MILSRVFLIGWFCGDDFLDTPEQESLEESKGGMKETSRMKMREEMMLGHEG